MTCLRLIGISLVTLCLSVASQSGLSEESGDSNTAIAGQNTLDMQRELIGQLTGHNNSKSSGTPLTPRNTAEERAQAAGTLIKAMEALGFNPIEHNYRLKNVNGLVDVLLSPYKGINIYTLIPATGPSDEYVILGAHYDSDPGSPGAVDNGSGVALVYGLAASLSQLQSRKLNFIAVFFDQEEDDEIGSKAFVKYLQTLPYTIHSAHIFDLIGWDEDGDKAVEVQSPGPLLEKLYKEAAARLNIPLYITEGASSDNESFLEAGYHAALMSEEWFNDDSSPYYGKPGDTYETVDFAYLASSTALALEVLKTLAENPDES